MADNTPAASAPRGNLVLTRDVAEALIKELQLAISESEGARSLDDTSVQSVTLKPSERATAILTEAFRDIPVCCIDRTCADQCPPPSGGHH